MKRSPEIVADVGNINVSPAGEGREPTQSNSTDQIHIARVKKPLCVLMDSREARPERLRVYERTAQ